MRRRVPRAFVMLNAIKARNNDDLDLLRDGLSAISDGVRRCNTRIDRAYKSGPDEYGEAVLEQEIGIVEALLGCAFVLCQVYITQVVAKVRALHRFAKNKKLKTTTTKKQAIMQYDGAHVPQSRVTKVEVIDALANYFKHQDEWGSWTDLGNNAKRTVCLVEKVGISRESRDLRIGAAALGNRDCEVMDTFTRIVADWSTKVFAGYKEELRDKS